MGVMAKFLCMVVLIWRPVSLAPSAREPRLSLAAQMPSYFYQAADGTYSFGYDIFDPDSGNKQFRSEERYPNGTVVGSYGYNDALGKSRRYNYIADERGYRVASEKLIKETYSLPIIDEPPTESSVSWTRPPKRNNSKPKPLERRKFNYLQPPTNYLLY
ncbi:larval cuticle protein 1-like [Leptidea sinapis]|uniref:larval cuticle protein 1-like n=1 Tax=Leptidea sinapis TaxID=189913 RepID=UPI00213FBABD|nr:larval cuticle protein 1-like [Leptidea sinapis]